MNGKVIHYYNGEILCNKTYNSTCLESTHCSQMVTCKNCRWLLSRDKKKFNIKDKKCMKCGETKESYKFNGNICFECEQKEADKILKSRRKLHPKQHIMAKNIIF